MLQVSWGVDRKQTINPNDTLNGIIREQRQKAAAAVKSQELLLGNFMAFPISTNERYLAGAFSTNNRTISANFTNFEKKKQQQKIKKKNKQEKPFLVSVMRVGIQNN